jgi:two-component system sensor histidine kinase YesM
MFGSMVRRKFFSLQYKLMFALLGILLLLMFIFGTVYYLQSSQTLKEKVSLSNLYTVSQIGRNIEFMAQDVHATSLYMIQDANIRHYLKEVSLLSESQREEETEKITQSLMVLLGSKPFIQSIHFQTSSGIVLDTGGTRQQIDKAIAQQVSDMRGGFIWYGNQTMSYLSKTMQVISLARDYNDINDIKQRLALLQINVNEDYIANLYRDPSTGIHGEYLLVDKDNRIVSSLAKERLGQPLPYKNERLSHNLKGKNGYFYSEFDGMQYLVTYYSVDGMEAKLIHFVKVSELLNEMVMDRKLITALIVLCIVVCIGIVAVFSLKVLRPLKQLRLMMENVRKEDFDTQIQVEGYDEISLLGKSFNKMSSRLKELIEQVYSVQLKRKEAELKALQAQVNPHFLYNTLDTIYWVSRMEQAFETSKLVEALSKLFRLSLNSGDEMTTVKNEIDHLRHYITIQEKRYEDRICFTIEADDNLLEYKTIKLLIQPLVENSIYHGIEKNRGRGQIDIRVYAEEDSLVFDVTDNGIGVDLEEMNRLLQQTMEDNRGFAIKNVHDRIQLYCNSDYGITFLDNPSGQGTRVIVRQPLEK